MLCSSGAPARWPDDRLIGGHGLEGYIAVALTGADGTQIGHIGVMAHGRLALGQYIDVARRKAAADPAAADRMLALAREQATLAGAERFA